MARGCAVAGIAPADSARASANGLQVVECCRILVLSDPATWAHHASRTVVVGLLAAAWSLACPSAAHASLMSPELEDAVAKYIAIFVLFFVPVVLIVLFWMVHVLPEKIAHKRHHPQFEAITHAVPAVARLRRAALAAGLAVGVHEAGRLQTGLRNRQASRLLQGARPPGAGKRHRRHTAARGRARRARRASQ